MRILQILPELNVGGVERGTVDFAKYLAAHGHHSVVVSNGGALVESLERGGSKHYTLPVHKKSLWTMIKMTRALRQIIENERIDIVHARSRVPAWIACRACRKTNASFITTCHGYYGSPWFSQVMGFGKLVIVPSDVIGRHMIQQFKVPRENIRCIPRSVDLEKFNIPRQDKTGDPAKVVTIVGRITPLKGHSYFIQSMVKVVRSMPYVKIWIIGDAPPKKEMYRRELELLVRRLGLENQVEFLGNRKNIPELLARTDVLVLSTVTQEAFGRVILEAQAVGVPVVATKVGGVVDIIDDGKTGILVMPKDTDAMAREVMRLLKDKTLGEQLTKEAQRKLKDNFTLEHMGSRTIEVYKELLDMTNILVIKLSSMGDVVLITASLKALREKFPTAKIYCLVGKESSSILHNCPYLDDLIIFDPQNKEKEWLGLLNLTRHLRKFKFDKVIDFQNNRKSHLLAFLSFAKESYGFHNGKWSFLLSHHLKEYRNDINPIAHQFQLLHLLKIPYKENHTLELWPSAQDKEDAAHLLESEWLGNSKQIIGINISASEKWPTKNWPVDHLARLCDILASRNIRVIITGLKKDRERVNHLMMLTKAKPAVFIGKTDLMQLAALIQKCNVFISPDSAPLHVATAVGTPAIAFFGPTDPLRHSPPSPKNIILNKKLQCSPCYSGHCKIKTHACMKDIMPEEVARHVEILLGETT